MNQTDRKSIGRSTKAAAILLAVIVYVILTGGWASAQQGSGLSAVGAVDPANGYPKWHMDGSRLQLAPCLLSSGKLWISFRRALPVLRTQFLGVWVCPVLTSLG